MTSLLLFAIFGKLTDLAMVWLGSKLLYWQTDLETGNNTHILTIWALRFLANHD
jgi:hypothetical protein